MTTKTPIISILMCNYNYGKYITSALESVYRQTYPNLELIIIDDCSEDNSVDIIKKYINNKTKIKVNLKINKKNQGISYARNEALNIAKGEYILFLDSDDTIPENYIENMFRTAVINNADVVYGDMKSFGIQKGEINFPEYDQHTLLLYNYVNISSLVKKEKIGIQKFDLELNKTALEDYDFWLGLSLKKLKFVKANNTYLNYRIHRDSRNNNTRQTTEKSLEFIKLWKYIFFKYQKQYPKIITYDLIFEQIDNQINQLKTVEDNLTVLNSIIHNELKPEIKKQRQHVKYQKNLIEKKNNKIEELQIEINALLNSNDYILGHWFLNKVKKANKLIHLGNHYEEKH